jgi:hypothetical protein
MRSLLARYLASDDQNLRVFKEFYCRASPERRRKLYEFVTALSQLIPADAEEQAVFLQDIGCTGDGMIGVQVQGQRTLSKGEIGGEVAAAPIGR